MVNRIGQMKVQQTAFMLVALTIFFILVGLFALTFYFSGLRESKQLLDEKEAFLLVSNLANAPELSCGNAFGGTKSDCVDFDKAMVLKTRETIYSKFFGVSGIEIQKLYPDDDFEVECTNATYPECGNLVIFETAEEIGIDKSAFVALCRKEKSGTTFYNKCELAKLIVRVANEN